MSLMWSSYLAYRDLRTPSQDARPCYRPCRLCLCLRLQALLSHVQVRTAAPMRKGTRAPQPAHRGTKKRTSAKCAFWRPIDVCSADSRTLLAQVKNIMCALIV